MSFKSLVNTASNAGVKPQYQPWEVHLTRKLNIMALSGFLNVCIGMLVFIFFRYYEFIPECILILFLSPLIFIFNIYKSYIWSAYMFYLIGWTLFISLGLKMGIDSLVFLLFFPLILSLVEVFSRKELLKHLIINVLICFTFIVVLLVGNKKEWFYIHPTSEMTTMLKYINAFFSFAGTFSFLIVLNIENMRQEKLIANVLKEKEILLAEVFHRVKNNMNIVTSLLNLKKNASDSEVVKQALEECKNRVYSMALVHQNIYKINNFTDLDMKDYIHDLVDELIDSNGNSADTEVAIKCDEISMDIAKSVPFGLILNELITNSFKYARLKDIKLRIEILVKLIDERISLKYSDNGPGLNNEVKKNNTLGIELIKSLSEQVDGEFGFVNDNGLVFNLEFKLK